MKKEQKWYTKGWNIFIIILVIFFAYSYYSDSRPEKFLEDEGYEVLDYRCSLGSAPSVEMVSFGDRNGQVWSGLISLYNHCPDAKDSFLKSYLITIIEPTRECNYFIDEVVVRAYFEKDVNDTELINSMDYKMWEMFVEDEKKGIDDDNYISYSDIATYNSILEGEKPEISAFSIIELEIKRGLC